MSDALSREDAMEILEMIQALGAFSKAVLIGRPMLRDPSGITQEEGDNLIAVADRASKMLDKLSQQQSLGSKPE